MGKSDGLYIQMLGDYALSLDGAQVSLGKNAGAKFLGFLQMLWLAGDSGLSREEVHEALFQNVEFASLTNSMNNLVYQSRKQLALAKLQNAVSIDRRKDRYYWKALVPTSTDLQEFLDAADKAADDEDSLMAALSLYPGYLLPGTRGIQWIDEKREEIRRIWYGLVSSLSAIYRDKQDSTSLIRLHSQAAELDMRGTGRTEADLIMALLHAGDRKEALRQYNKALRFYRVHEKGNIPEPLEECAAHLSGDDLEENPLALKKQLLDVMSTDVAEAPERANGAFYCNYPSFIDTIRLLRRNLIREKKPATLMIVALLDYEGKPIRMKKKQLMYSAILEEAVRSVLRIGDSFTQNGPVEFLVLLPGADEENAAMIFDRIQRRLKEKAGTNASLSYRMLALSTFEGPLPFN
ncbi:MAG: bacterial transcriptional activator domain-containing protein [Lachnospiraceae bacterium]|nr:bacterial transcriptional activator domain-containing protein [Lachnospiraceae bacterium]